MTYDLSIAFATYNSSDYLDSFYISLFKQKLKNFEVIVVDDGSTDHSFDISLKWARKYKNIKVIRQKNSGLSVARNRGIEIASGKWLALPDPDDVLYPRLFNHLLNIATKHNLDVAVINGLHLFENRKPKLIFNNKIPVNKIMDGQDFLKFGLNSGSFLHTTWLNIYNLDFIKKNKIKFIPNLLHQDILWTTEVLFHAKRVMYSNEALYGYSHRSGSVTRQKVSDAKNIRTIKNYSKILSFLNDFNVRNKSNMKNISTFKYQISNEFSNIKRNLRKIKDRSNFLRAINYLDKKNIFQLVIENSTFSLNSLKDLLLVMKFKILLKITFLNKKI